MDCPSCGNLVTQKYLKSHQKNHCVGNCTSTFPNFRTATTTPSPQTQAPEVRIPLQVTRRLKPLQEERRALSTTWTITGGTTSTPSIDTNRTNPTILSNPCSESCLSLRNGCQEAEPSSVHTKGTNLACGTKPPTGVAAHIGTKSQNGGGAGLTEGNRVGTKLCEVQLVPR